MALYRFCVRLPEEIVIPMKIRAIQENMTIQEFVAAAIVEKSNQPLPDKPPQRIRRRRAQPQEAATDGQ